MHGSKAGSLDRGTASAPGHPDRPLDHLRTFGVASQETIRELRHELGSTLLVVLAHSWGSVQRHNDCSGAITALQRLCDEQGYQRVIWLRHWQDPQSLPLPPDWIQACNGHRSNPWFLDSMRTLLELCDGLPATVSAPTWVTPLPVTGVCIGWKSTATRTSPPFPLNNRNGSGSNGASARRWGRR